MKIKRLNDKAIIPLRADEGSAGYDLYICDDGETLIEPHTTIMLSTGWAMEIPEGYVGLIFARSGLASKKSLAPANCVGVIDSTYRGEVKIPLHNYGEVSRMVSCGERVAQLVIMPYIAPDIEIVRELSDTERGEGGFGHTGE